MDTVLVMIPRRLHRFLNDEQRELPQVGVIINFVA
jgi:hypothetical protein